MPALVGKIGRQGWRCSANNMHGYTEERMRWEGKMIFCEGHKLLSTREKETGMMFRQEHEWLCRRRKEQGKET
jgi:hypothetical protein